MGGAAAADRHPPDIPAGSVSRLLKPRSIAIDRASDKPGSLGASVLSNLDRHGFAGALDALKRVETGETR